MSARWRNGSTRAWRRLRAEILERDGYRCTNLIHGRRCTATTRLEVHHTKEHGDELLAPKEELATICRPCHETTFTRELLPGEELVRAAARALAAA